MPTRTTCSGASARARLAAATHSTQAAARIHVRRRLETRTDLDTADGDRAPARVVRAIPRDRHRDALGDAVVRGEVILLRDDPERGQGTEPQVEHALTRLAR